jgi:hypothetical protein
MLSLVLERALATGEVIRAVKQSPRWKRRSDGQLGWKLQSSPPATAPSPTAPTTIEPPPPTTQPPTVVYEVTGDGSADLTIGNASGGIEQKTVNLPYSEELTRPPGGFVYLSAHLNGTGSISCRITYGGQVIQQASSQGEFVTASCSGSI